jgi:hypothetical protein
VYFYSATAQLKMEQAVTKNQRNVYVAIAGTAVILTVVLLTYHLIERNNQVPCPDGVKRVRLDSGAFQTKYSANTLRLEINLKDQKSFATELGAKQLQQMSEAVQLARLNMKALADGFNACAVSPEEFNSSRNRFQRMESIAGEVNALSARPRLTSDDQALLSKLVDEYVALSRGGSHL